MGIKGITIGASPAFPSIGKLRKGDEKGIRGPGKELPYWRFTSERQEVKEAFVAAYGKNPVELDVYLPYKSVEDNFSTWKEEWSGGGLVHRCDGETCTIWLKPDGTYSREPKPCPGGCKEVGRLSVILPALFRAGFVGYVTMETHSINDILSIHKCLLATCEARRTEDLTGIAFVLRRVEEEISTPGKGGKRIRRKKWMAKLQPAADWVLAQLENARPQLEASAVPVPTAIDADYEEQPTETEALEQAEPAKHWIEREDVRRAFWSWASRIGLSSGEIHEALGVEHVADFDGSMKAAKAKIEAWISANAERDNAPPADEPVEDESAEDELPF